MFRLLTLVALCASLSSSAQTPCEAGFADIYPCQNIDLWAFMPKADFGDPSGLNDIWGWTDQVSGREFAIVCTRSGTAFVEVTAADAPVWLGTLPSNIEGNNTWRDAKVIGNFAFIGSEFGDHGMQVFDLTKLVDPALEAPVEFEHDALYDGFGKSHNIVANPATNHVFGVGTNTAGGGFHVVNVVDPLNPQIIGTYAESGYTHDAQVVIYNGPDTQYFGKEIAFACNANHVAILDLSDPTDIQEISTVEYEETGYVHQGWLSEDQRYFFTNDELDELNNGVNTTTRVFDVSDLSNPVLHTTFVAETTSIDHNHYVNDTLLYQSNYRAGLRVLDIGDIDDQEIYELAHFDVSPDTDAPGFTGTWSNYPYFASGTIVVSDITEGLFVLKLNVTIIPGCTFELACNYNPEATEDDSSCEFAPQFYDCDGNCYEDADDDGICDGLEIDGCTDPLACNYDEEATDDDLSCTYPDNPLYDCEGNCLNDSDGDGVCDEEEISGCMDQEACNFNFVATDDSGICTYWEIGLFDGPIDVNIDGNPSGTYTYTGQTGSTLNWMVTGGDIVSGQGTSTVEILWTTPGDASLTVTEVWLEGCSGDAVLEVTVVSVGIEESIEVIASVYPNPASTTLVIELSLNDLANVQLIDAQGRVVLEAQITSKTVLDVAHLSAGTYVVSVNQNGQQNTQTVVID